MRNKLLILLIFSLFTGNVLAQNEHVNSKKYTILLSGASFASPENGRTRRKQHHVCTAAEACAAFYSNRLNRSIIKHGNPAPHGCTPD